MLEGFWRDLLVTSVLLNGFLAVLVMWFRSTLLRDIRDLQLRVATAEEQRAEKAELKALADKVSIISRDYASRDDIERISTKLDNIYLLFMNYANQKEGK
jgi:hypothetical protein